MLATVVSMGTPTGERRYGGKTASERRSERHEKLLDTGLELFGTRGYAATSIEALCGAAGLNARYFYEEFDGREGLLQAVYDRHVEKVFSVVGGAILAAAPTPRDRLSAGLTAFIHHTLADPRAARVNYFEMVGVSAGLEARRREVLANYADLTLAQLKALQGAGGSTAGADLRIAAVALVSATDGLIIDLLSRADAGAGLDPGAQSDAARGRHAPTEAEMTRIVTVLTALFTAAISR
jgi:AcrR family transcriptional regulator